MNIFSFIYNEFLYKPIFEALVFFYKILGNDLGLAILLLTLVIRIILFPLTRKALLSQKKMTDLQPKIKGIQEKFKNNREEQARQIMSLYKENKVNPLGSIGSLFIQLPILIALYQVLLAGLKQNGMIIFNPLFLGLLDLSRSNWILGILVGVSQYFASQLTLGQMAIQNQMQKQMMYFMPAFMAIIAITLPAGISLYLLAAISFSLIEQKILAYGTNQKNN